MSYPPEPPRSRGKPIAITFVILIVIGGGVAVYLNWWGSGVKDFDSAPILQEGASPDQLGDAYQGESLVAAGGEEPAAGGEEPAAGGEEPAAGGEEPAAGGEEPAAGGEEPVAGGEEPAAGGEEPAAGGEEPAAGGEEPAAGGEEPAAGGEEPAAGGEEPATGGEEPAAGGEVDLAAYEQLLADAKKKGGKKRVALLRQAIEVNPKGDKALSELAMLLMEGRKTRDEALSLAQRAVQANHENGQAWLIIGYIYQITGKRAESREAYKKCSECPGPKRYTIECRRLL